MGKRCSICSDMPLTSMEMSLGGILQKSPACGICSVVPQHSLEMSRRGLRLHHVLLITMTIVYGSGIFLVAAAISGMMGWTIGMAHVRYLNKQRDTAKPLCFKEEGKLDCVEEGKLAVHS